MDRPKAEVASLRGITRDPVKFYRAREMDRYLREQDILITRLTTERDEAVKVISDLLNMGIEMDDERLHYVVGQIDRCAIEDARALLATLSSKEQSHAE